MKTSPIPLVRVHTPKPQKAVISAAELDFHIAASQRLLSTQQKAQAMEQQALEIISTAEHEAEKIRQDAYIESQAQAAQHIETARYKAIEEAVDWLEAESNIELGIANRLEERIRSLAVSALFEFSGKQDQAELSVRRLSRKIPEMIRNDRLRLRVHPLSFSVVQHAFQETHVTVSADETLAMGQAELESDLVRIKLDVDAHLNILIARLVQRPQPTQVEAGAQTPAADVSTEPPTYPYEKLRTGVYG